MGRQTSGAAGAATAVARRAGACAGQQQVALFQDVIRVELRHRGDLDPFEVAGAPVEDRVVGGQADQDGPTFERPQQGLRLGLADGLDRLGLGQVGPSDGSEGLRDDLRLGAGQPQPVDHQRLPVLELRQQGHPDCGADRLLGHRVAIVAVAAGEGDASPLPLVRPLAADAGIAGPLLAEELFARTGHIGTAARVDRADPTCSQVHQHDFVQQLLVHRAAEIGRVDRFLAHPFAGDVIYGDAEHGDDIPDGPPELRESGRE